MACVKTAISMQESLFKRVDRLAKQMKISRSKVIATALEKYLGGRDEAELIARINAAYEDSPDEEERPLQRASLARLRELTKDDEW